MLDYVEATFTQGNPAKIKARKCRGQSGGLLGRNPLPAAKAVRSALLGLPRQEGRRQGPRTPMDIVPRPRNLRNSSVRAELEHVPAIRLESIKYGVQGTAMPRLVRFRARRPSVGDLDQFHLQHERLGRHAKKVADSRNPG